MIAGAGPVFEFVARNEAIAIMFGWLDLRYTARETRKESVGTLESKAVVLGQSVEFRPVGR